MGSRWSAVLCPSGHRQGTRPYCLGQVGPRLDDDHECTVDLGMVLALVSASSEPAAASPPFCALRACEWGVFPAGCDRGSTRSNCVSAADSHLVCHLSNYQPD